MPLFVVKAGKEFSGVCFDFFRVQAAGKIKHFDRRFFDVAAKRLEDAVGERAGGA